MAVTPEIKTKFTLDGIKEAASGFRRFGTQTRETLDRVKASAGEALEPMQQDIERAKRSMRLLNTAALTTGRIGFAALTRGATLAFRGISLGAVAAVGSITAVGAAAVKASRDAADELDKIGKDARRLGIGTEDLSVLNFAAEREGANPDEITKGIAKIGYEWGNIQTAIAKADEEFQRFRAHANEDAMAAIRKGDSAGLQSIFSEYETLAGSSLSEVRRRMSNATSQRQLEDLKAQEQQLLDSFGPAGQAIFGLQKYGLEIEKVAKGGTEGFIALSDAIRRVEDPAEKVRYSVLLFGEDAGPQMLNLLNSGREGIEEYRKELERLGGVVTKADAAMAEAYTNSEKNFRRSIGGVKLAVGRELLPLLTETNKSLTDFMVQNRNRIADVMKEGFTALRNFGLDIISLFRGNTSGIRTEWLSAAVRKFQEAKAVVADLREEVETVFSGGHSRHEWLNSIYKGFVRVRDLAKDVFAIFSGGDAVNYEWLNDLRDGVVAFAEAFKAAFDDFVQVLTFVKDNLLKPIFDLFNEDITQWALFLGIARITGALGLAVTAVRALASAVGALFSLGGGGALASSISAIAGAAGGVGAAGAVGTAAAGAGAAGALGRGAALARGAGILGAAVGGGYLAGRWLGQEAWERSGAKRGGDAAYEAQAELFRRQGDASFAKMYQGWSTDRRRSYWENNGSGVRYYRPEAAPEWARSDYGTFDMSGRSTQPRERIAVDLNVNGRPYPMETDALTARQFSRDLRQSMRTGY